MTTEHDGVPDQNMYTQESKDNSADGSAYYESNVKIFSKYMNYLSNPEIVFSPLTTFQQEQLKEKIHLKEENPYNDSDNSPGKNGESSIKKEKKQRFVSN